MFFFHGPEVFMVEVLGFQFEVLGYVLDLRF